MAGGESGDGERDWREGPLPRADSAFFVSARQSSAENSFLHNKHGRRMSPLLPLRQLAAGLHSLLARLLPWLARSRFPVNSFSANYKTPGVGGTTPLIRFLYRLKKWQYLLYKRAGRGGSAGCGRGAPLDGRRGAR